MLCISFARMYSLIHELADHNPLSLTWKGWMATLSEMSGGTPLAVKPHLYAVFQTQNSNFSGPSMDH